MLENPIESETPPVVIHVPTQSQFPAQAVLRTLIAYVVGAVFVVIVREIPGIEGMLEQVRGPLVDMLTNAAIIAAGGFVTWLMTKPRINAFLTKLGLGAQPKRAAVVVEG